MKPRLSEQWDSIRDQGWIPMLAGALAYLRESDFPGRKKMWLAYLSACSFAAEAEKSGIKRGDLFCIAKVAVGGTLS